MADNEEPIYAETTELPQVAPVPTAATAPTAAAPPVVVEQPTGHSTTRVLLAAGAGALLVFLIAAAGIVGYLVGSHSGHDGGIRPARMAQLQGGQGGPAYGGPGMRWHPQGVPGGMPQFPGMPGQQPGGTTSQVPQPGATTSPLPPQQ